MRMIFGKSMIYGRQSVRTNLWVLSAGETPQNETWNFWNTERRKLKLTLH